MTETRKVLYTHVDDNAVGECCLCTKTNMYNVQHEHYSYELYNVNDNNDKKENSIVFHILLYSETLLLGLIKYYKPIVEQFDSNFKQSTNIYYSITNSTLLFEYFDNNVLISHGFGALADYRNNYALNSEKLYDYLSENKHNAFTHEMIIKFLVYYYGMFDDDMDVDDFVKGYYSRYSTLDDYNMDTLYKDDPSVLYYCVPITTLLTIDEIKFIKAWNYNIGNRDFYNVSTKWLKLYYRIFKIINSANNYDNSITVKNYVIDNNNTMYLNDTSLDQLTINDKCNTTVYLKNPYHVDTDEFYDYLINLPVSDFLSVYEIGLEIHKYSDDMDLVKDYFRLLIKHNYIMISDENSVILIENFIQLLKNNGINTDSLSLNSFIVKRYKAVSLFMEYVANMLSNNNTVKYMIDNFDSLVGCSHFNFGGYWFKDYVVYLLLEKIGDVEKVLKVAADFVKNDIELTNKQWLEFVNNYEEYNDMPVSWSANLV